MEVGLMRQGQRPQTRSRVGAATYCRSLQRPSLKEARGGMEREVEGKEGESSSG